MSLVFGLPAIGVAWYVVRCSIVAGLDGLSLNGFLRRRHLNWNEIQDYELRVPAEGRSKSGLPVAHLKVSGKWRSISRSYLPYDALLERIQQEAKWSQSRVWQQSDLREDGYWPKVFVYKDVSGWRLLGQYFLCFLALLGSNLLKVFSHGVGPAVSGINMIWSGLSVWGRVGFVALPFLLFGSYPLLILARYPAIKTRRRYLTQKIVASREGLFFIKDGQEAFSRWEEIESYHLEMMPGHFQPTLCVLETRRARIEFVSGAEWTKTLMKLTTDQAHNTTTKSWQHVNGADEDVLGGAASLWRGGRVGVGQKFHDHRTRSARAAIICGLLMTGLFLSSLLSGQSGRGWSRSTGDVITEFIFLQLTGLPTVVGLLATFFTTVQCETDGLRKTTVWGQRYLHWNEIEKVQTNGSWLVITGRRGKIRISSLMADFKGLQNEIEKYSGKTCVRNGNAF